jgi:cellulose synthase operon protein C
VVIGFLKDPILSKSKLRDQGRYYYGFASFLIAEYDRAQQALTTLAPFNDPYFGSHARYLLARTHYLAEERAEAALHYEAVLLDYANRKKTAIQRIDELADAGLLQFRPMLQEQLLGLLNGPPPDHVMRATFWLRWQIPEVCSR